MRSEIWISNTKVPSSFQLNMNPFHNTTTTTKKSCFLLSWNTRFIIFLDRLIFKNYVMLGWILQGMYWNGFRKWKLTMFTSFKNWLDHIFSLVYFNNLINIIFFNGSSRQISFYLCNREDNCVPSSWVRFLRIVTD